MKLADYVVDFLVKQGLKHNFLVSGGAVIHLVDSSSKHPDMQYICGQHEEHCAAAADMYARVTRNLGVAMVTSGPGATNLVTSVCNAFFDSVPMLCITGQVSRFRLRKSEKLRQRGFQETDVVSIFKSITKYAKLILDPEDIRYELEKAIYFAKEGRPGPVVLDIPDDLQRVDIDPQSLRGFIPPQKMICNHQSEAQQLIRLIEASQKPILIFGMGVQCAQAAEEALAFAERFQIPVVTTWGGADVIAHLHPLNMGRIGICGPRGGNFAVQQADLVIAFGSRLSPMVTGGKQNLFATQAKKVMVDIDAEELAKFGSDTFVIDLPIQADLKEFLFACRLQNETLLKEEAFSSWITLIKNWIARYPICPPQPDLESKIQPHIFVREVSRLAKEGDIVIGDTGANLSWMMQAFEVKEGQRIFSAWNHTPMGYSLPASIGAVLGSNQNVICLIGDGGLMMCMQELATIQKYNLPIRIFLFNNKGHGIQKQTIDTWLQSNYAAVNVATGLSFPDYELMAKSFHIPYFRLSCHRDLDTLSQIWNEKGPFLCDVEIIESQKIVPMLKFGSGLEDLDPKLSREELERIQQESNQITSQTVCMR